MPILLFQDLRIYVKTNHMKLMALACLWIIFKQNVSADKIPSVIRLRPEERLKESVTIIS